MSRKGVKSRTGVPGLGSTRTKAKGLVDRMRKPRADLEQQLEQYRRELAESLEQQTATAEVLRIISGSPDNLEPVFETILANTTRLCEAKFGTLYHYDGDAFRAVAFHNAPPAY